MIFIMLEEIDAQIQKYRQLYPSADDLFKRLQWDGQISLVLAGRGE
jgi:hypothetical protein